MKRNEADTEVIFHTARAKGSRRERAAYLEGACGDDDRLRRVVESLLDADAEAEGFLEPEDEDPGEGPGSLVGNYKLLQKIGEGGFGAVYMAEQKQPVKRKVALKIIKLGMDTKQVIARFEAERQALAMMDHPNIAKVLDAGATETGRPYFVMELVRGVPITEYCDTENLSTRERLELFIAVCHAVQHAHHKGIIHRDIKPTNVLVTLHDGKPVPKVIDFGIAKATNAELTEKTLFTEFHQFIGTPEYMSPEQAELSGLDIDSRSDIYSLGVLLYEILTGSTPLVPGRLRTAALDEIQRMIREEEPPKPSTRLSSLDAECGTGVARHRRTEPGALTRQLRGDVDWIVMKALEKDRARRYGTATELARDIEHHLRDEPVLAGPPSKVYRLRKFVRRNRGGVLAACIVLAALLAGLGLATAGLVEARRAREIAMVERVRAEDEEARTQAVANFYADMLGSSNPFERGSSPVGFSEVTVLELIRSAEPSIEVEFGDRPLLEADVRATFGRTLGGLGQFREAGKQLRRALELQRADLGENHEETISTMWRLGWVLGHAGEGEESVKMLRAALELSTEVHGIDNEATIDIQRQLATRLFLQGQLEEAEPMARDAVERSRRVVGEGEWTTLWAENGLAMMLNMRGRAAEAEALFRSVREKGRRLAVEDKVVVLFASLMGSFSLDILGRYDEAEVLLDQAYEGYRASFGENHPWGPHILSCRAGILLDRGELGEAEELLRSILEAQRRTLGDDHPLTCSTSMDLIPVLIELGKLVEAEELARRHVESGSGGFDRWDYLRSRYQLGWALLDQGKLEEALPLLEHVLDEMTRTFPNGFLQEPSVRAAYGRCLSGLGRHAEGEQELLRAIETMQEMRGPAHPYLAEVADDIANLYEAWDKSEQAAVWRAKASPR